MKLDFVKMEGCGNDYVYVDCVNSEFAYPDKAKLAVKLSDRHFGIGGDGLIFVNRSDKAGFEMEMYNADGSRGEMCGNGMRCVAKLIHDRGYAKENKFTVESMGSVKHIEVISRMGDISEISVDMGEPILVPEKIPVLLPGDQEKAVDIPITAGKLSARYTGVSMGNPHAVIFMDSLNGYSGTLAGFPIEKYGPSFEYHELFPARINTEFVEVIDKETVNMRVWERGSGETFACGTGCCATLVACVLNGRTGREVTVRLKGGSLKIRWDIDNHIYMTGPARTVFTGTISI